MNEANYSDPELFDAQAFEQALANAKAPVKVFRQALEDSKKILQGRFLGGSGAYEAVTSRAWLIDEILTHAWRQFAWDAHDTPALVAVGGYGRRELHPASDIDLLLLFQKEVNETNKSAVEGFLTFLWDIGLEVGHGVRNLEECGKEAAADITVVTNLLEARLLIGSPALFNAMRETISTDKIWSGKAFFEAKLEEQHKRYSRFHDTAYNLEPNIKESPGGLRDLQLIGWVTKRHFGADTLHDLVYYGFLSEEEYHTLNEAQEFLWSIRCLLHAVAGRREDRLGFDYQRTLAKQFGYKDGDNNLAVEQFMRRYYRTVKKVRTLTEMLMQLFREKIVSGGDNQVKPLNRRFQIHNNYIEVVHQRVFSQYPFALLEVFLLIQQNPEIQGIRADTIRLILQHNKLIDESFREDTRTRSLFFEIIRAPRGQTRAFRLMNTYGVLERYIPAFGNIVGRMQYDLFHAYTVDQHILFVLRNVRRFTIEKYNHEFKLCSQIMQERLPKPELLYLAALFHDIAKGRGGDHSELGEHDAMAFCLAHGLSSDDSRLVAWLVRHHLLMSYMAQREDISDPEVVYRFARILGDDLHLDYLYLLTVADIRGTNPSMWNSWKAGLLADFYYKARSVLQQGLQKPVEKKKQVSEIQEKALLLLDASIHDEVKALWQDIQDEYFLRSSPTDLAHEARQILNTPQGSPLVILREDTRGGTQFLIYCRDRSGLFADTGFYLERQCVNVMEAYIIVTDSDMILLSYTVLNAHDQKPIAAEQAETMRAGLENVAMAKNAVEIKPINRIIPRQHKHFPVPTRVTFSRDTDKPYTVMEVVTTDRPGILSQIAKVLMQCGVHVKNAHIATFGSRVEDIFYISDKNGQAVSKPEQLDCLRESISDKLDQAVEPAEVMEL